MSGTPKMPIPLAQAMLAQGVSHSIFFAPASARKLRRAMARKAAKEAARKGKGGNHA